MMTTRSSTLQPTQWLGLALLLVLLLFALGEAAFYTVNPNTQQLARTFALPSTELPLGADQFGRDMFARLGAALRLSFLLSTICVATSALAGVAAGVCAAWAGGIIERFLNFLVNTILALPGLVLVLLFAALIPGSFIMLYLAISLTLWVEYFRLIRASAKPIINGPQLQSSMLLGFNRWYCFRRHIWPAIAPDVYTLAAFGAATSIITMASVGFVYVGLQPPTAELGLMIVELFPYYSDAPWLLAQPLIALFLMVLGFHLLAGRKTL